MKRFIPSLILVLTLVWNAGAQITLTNLDGDDVTGQEVFMYGSIEDIDLKKDILITNNSEGSLNVFARKIEIDVVPGSSNTFCWNGLCYAPFVEVSHEPIVLRNGETSAEGNFYVELTTGGVSGTTVLKYEFFNDDESFETVSVTINFVIEGAEDATSVNNSFRTSWSLNEASPNPARGHTWINFDLPNNAGNAQIVLRNLLGNTVLTENVSPTQRRVRVDTSNLNNGIYIYSLIIDNQTVKSKRLIVSN